MHITDGILSLPVLAGGAALAVGGVAVGLRGLGMDRMPRTALLAAAFFVASLIHVPVPPSQAHLILNGLLGLFLGWAAFPAILVALALQALLFSYGGITTLGVNTFNLALPALLCAALLRPLLKHGLWGRTLAGVAAGLLGITGSACLAALSLLLSGEDFFTLAWLFLAAHVPIMIIEAILSALIINFLARIKPQVLQNYGE